jgi:hypothetical protein
MCNESRIKSEPLHRDQEVRPYLVDPEVIMAARSRRRRSDRRIRCKKHKALYMNDRLQ